MAIKKQNNVSNEPTVVIDNSLKKYKDKVLFPEKLARDTEAIMKFRLPKELQKPKQA